MNALDPVQILDSGETCPKLPLVDGPGETRAVVWPGMGATMRSFHRISLAGGARTVELAHPMEAVYYVISGAAAARDLNDGTRHPLTTGSFAHVEPATPYVIEAAPEGAEIIGGPCPPDPALYERLEP